MASWRHKVAPRLLLTVLLVSLCGWGEPGWAEESSYRLVFGSFQNPDNAEDWARRVGSQLRLKTQVQETRTQGRRMYRVVTEPLQGNALLLAVGQADAAALSYWRLADNARAAEPPGRESGLPDYARSPAMAGEPRSAARESQPSTEMDLDLGFQARSYWDTGLDGQSRFQPSLSGMFHYRRYFGGGQDNFTFTPFARLDAEDSNRTHADLRELYYSRVGDDWDLHVGFRQVFWGVTEFHHLIDVINQTDWVENIDGEDKLGQPMINLSLIRDWGILDFYVLPGFRERTFPGDDGRLRFGVPVDDSHANYESGAQQWRVDGAVRWAHSIGPLELGVYHFSGTNREPLLEPLLRPSGELVLQPYYEVMDQTGLDAQGIFGQYLVKLEALTRSASGERFAAATGGFERTLVGVLGTRADLGLVLEYMYDDRGDDATTVFEHDLAFGTRWRWNDVADSHALLGVIWDVQTDEYIVRLEGGRRLGDDWQLLVEGRVFGGADEPPTEPLDAVLQALADTENKTGSLQRDHFLQVELTRFF